MKSEQMLHLTDAKYAGDYRIHLVFNDGHAGIADLRPVVFDDHRSVFRSLRDPSVFQQFFIDHGVLCWPGDVDIAPEYVYFLAFREDESLQQLFEAWGYVQAEVSV